MAAGGEYPRTTQLEPAVPVGAVRIVARYIGPRRWPEADVREPMSEADFDESVQSELNESIGAVKAVLGDSLPPGYIVQEARVGQTNSVELFLLIAAAYRAIRDVNEVWDTLVAARDHAVEIVNRLIFFGTVFDRPQFYVSGRVEPYVTVPAGLLPASLAASPHQSLAVASSPPVVRIGRMPSVGLTPTRWTRDVFLSRLVVPLVFITALVGLGVGVLAAVRFL